MLKERPASRRRVYVLGYTAFPITSWGKQERVVHDGRTRKGVAKGSNGFMVEYCDAGALSALLIARANFLDVLVDLMQTACKW